MGDDQVVVGRRRGRGWRQVSHGVHRAVPLHQQPVGEPPEDAHRRAREERLADLRALQLALPAAGSFTHLTAAEVYGLWLPPVPEGVPDFLSLPKEHDRPQRRGLRVSRLSATITPTLVDGVRVAPVQEVLLACARDLGLLDLAVLVDCASKRGLCSVDELAETAAPRRRGAPALRAALPYVDPRSESPWETLLRMFHVLCDVPVESQFEVHDERGVFVARGDLRLSGTRTLHEYDGAVHRDRRTHVNDLARERGLSNNGWIRRGYTSTDLLARSHVILREADSTLGRPHDPRRLGPWLDALRNSLFSATGRARFASRMARDPRKW